MRWPIRALAFLAGLALLSSCVLFKRPGTIETPQGTVIGYRDAGKPPTIDSGGSVATITLPAGTNVTTVKEMAYASIPATESTPAQAAKPEREVTTFILPSPAKWEKTETRLSANAGTVDTSIAKAKIDAAENRNLLYASIGAAVIAGIFVFLHYKTPAVISGIGSVVFFLAWKVSNLPDWFWAIGACSLVGAALMYFGHERGEKSQNGTPDQ